MVENVKLRQIIAKIDFLRTLQQEIVLGENLTSGCHGNTLVGVTSKSTNLAKTTFLVSWNPGHIPIKFNKLERGTF